MEWNWNKVRMEQKCGGHYISTDYACFFFLTGTLQESQTSGGGRAEGVGCLNIVLKPLMLRSKILFQIAITTVNSRNWKTPHGICNTWHYHLPLSLTLTPSVNAIITHYSHFYV